MLRGHPLFRNLGHSLRLDCFLLIAPLELRQNLSVCLPKKGPVLVDVDISHFHVPVHVTEAIVDE